MEYRLNEETDHVEAIIDQQWLQDVMSRSGTNHLTPTADQLLLLGESLDAAGWRQRLLGKAISLPEMRAVAELGKRSHRKWERRKGAKPRTPLTGPLTFRLSCREIPRGKDV